VTIFLDKSISFLIFFGFSLFLLTPKGGVVVLLILALSIIGLFLKRNIKKDLKTWEKFLLLGFIGYFLLVFFSNVFFNGNLRDIDTASRFIFVIPIYLYLRKSKVNIRSLEYGVLMACFIFGINSIFSEFYDSYKLFQFSKHTGIVSFYGSMLGIASIFLLRKNKSFSYNLIVLICAFLGVSTALLGGGRGVWIAAILSFIIILYLNPLRSSKNEKFLISFIGIAFGLIGYLTPMTGVKERTELAAESFSSYYQEQKSDTSVGARLEMWKSSYLIFKENPIFGIGEGNFKEGNIELINKGLINSHVGRFNHPHGEYFTTIVEQGIVGLIVLLFLFFSPLFKCYKESKCIDLNTHSSILLVFLLSLLLHYIFYSITNGVFDHQNTTLFFAAYLSIGMGLLSSIRDKV